MPIAPPSNKGRKFPAEPLTRDEVLGLLAAASTRTSTGIRMRAHIAVLFGAGLRLAESLDLEPRDIDTAAQTVRVRVGKGRKARTVGIDAYSCALIERWLDRRSMLGLGARHRLFATYSAGQLGRPLQPRYVRSALARLAAKAGIGKRVHPHGLRHSLASDMADNGSSVFDIQRQLGHASVATTDRYIHALRPAGLLEHMRQRRWHGVVDDGTGLPVPSTGLRVPTAGGPVPGPPAGLGQATLARAVEGLGQVLEALCELVDADAFPPPGDQGGGSGGTGPDRAASGGKRYQPAA
jgi:hypothetical protein